MIGSGRERLLLEHQIENDRTGEQDEHGVDREEHRAQIARDQAFVRVVRVAHRAQNADEDDRRAEKHQSEGQIDIDDRIDVNPDMYIELLVFLAVLRGTLHDIDVHVRVHDAIDRPREVQFRDTIAVLVEEELNVQQEENGEDREENEIGQTDLARFPHAARQGEDPVERDGSQDPGAGLRKEVDREREDLAGDQRHLLKVDVEPSVENEVHAERVENEEINNGEKRQVDEGRVSTKFRTENDVDREEVADGPDQEKENGIDAENRQSYRSVRFAGIAGR